MIDPRWMAEAMAWVNKITSACGVMVLPIVGGIWLDQWLGSVCVFTLLGSVVGLGGGMYYLMQMTKVPGDRRTKVRISQKATSKNQGQRGAPANQR